MIDLTIITPTYNNWGVLNQMLRTLLSHAPHPYRIIVVNNLNERNEVDRLTALIRSMNYPYIDLMTMPENMWDSGSITVASERVDTPYMAAVHDDCLFIPGCPDLWKMLIDVARHKEVGIACPASNWASEFQDIKRTQTPRFIEVNFAHGCCTLFRMDAYREVGGHDFDPLVGDVDISLRLWKAGYASVCDRHAYIHHIGNATWSKQWSGYNQWAERMKEHLDDATNWLINKHGIYAVADLWRRSCEYSAKMAMWGDFLPDVIEALRQPAKEWTPGGNNDKQAVAPVGDVGRGSEKGATPQLQAKHDLSPHTVEPDDPWPMVLSNTLVSDDGPLY